MNMLIINNIFLGFMVSEIPRVSVFGYFPMSSYTFLGVILYNNLNFKEHIYIYICFVYKNNTIEVITCYIYIKKAELFTNIYFKTNLYFFVFTSYHVLFRNLGKSIYFNSTKKAIRIVNKNIFTIINNILILTNTNNLLFFSNILKFKDLINYKNMLFMQNVHLNINSQ